MRWRRRALEMPRVEGLGFGKKEFKVFVSLG